jgi:hypothetical protein
VTPNKFNEETKFLSDSYLIDSSFQEAYLERGADYYIDFLDEVLSAASQIKKDARALYGALLSAC